jgi:glyoxylase-like metal-dependent hydrolase (beta-lactamase superfamily II)/rhodanese-related sulfurtransferase
VYFEQFYLGCLSHASYMIGSGGDALVIDPQRDVEIYLRAAEAQGLTIRHIFETHLHADFVSGHHELAARTGATIYIGDKANAGFPHVGLTDDFSLSMGSVVIRALETPGHTPESMSLIVTDRERGESPWAVFTGDTLFIGDVGRPDLSPTHTPQQLAGLLYESLHGKLMRLDNSVLVYPAHGAGSLCGRNMRAERSSTIGTERLTNYALQIPSKEDFVAAMTHNLPARPAYFSEDAELNRAGAPALTQLPELTPISAAELKALLDQDHFALDVRSNADFAAAHIPKSVNIALSGQFASWAGALLGLSQNPILIADTPEQYAEARVRLARVGLEKCRGFLQGGIAAWKDAGHPLSSLVEVSAKELHEKLRSEDLQVLDVRRDSEFQAGHIPGAIHWPLDNFKVSPPEIDSSRPVAVHCKGGYRSTIACSLLRRAGFENIINVTGGFDAWQAEQLPVEAGQAELV